ncbi:phosphodiester glycosidase family protein [Bacillus sp. APMAM]|nr:phosphodiester glycosidase family protein [Bacillus sp. APMAM]RTZ53745.1 phosphodiester glycosidase family protein [Bacillus sp. SAJ1]
MDELKNKVNTSSRIQRKRKKARKRFWRVFTIVFVSVFIIGGGFLYGTNQGLQFRKMLVGSVLSTQHARYVKYMGFLLPQSEIDKLKKAFYHPPTVQTAVDSINNIGSKQLNIHEDTIDTANYTAKILVISDPTTVHLVQSRLPDKGQALFELISENQGIAGINGGGFVDRGGTGSGGKATGIVISQGNVLASPKGDRNIPQLVGGFLKDGQFITGKYSVNQLLNLGVSDAVSFGPQLIVNGVNRVTPAIDGAWGWAPRTAIGQAKNGDVIMIITDGRFYWNKTHRGASMSDMAQMFEKYQVTNAIAMDGGGSTTMIHNGKLLLKPATDTAVGMRYLPNAWVVIPH